MNERRKSDIDNGYLIILLSDLFLTICGSELVVMIVLSLVQQSMKSPTPGVTKTTKLILA